MSDTKKTPTLELTGLWKQKSKGGVDYLKGSLGGLNVMIFQNKDKKHEKAPDYKMVLGAKPRRTDVGEGGSAPSSASSVGF